MVTGLKQTDIKQFLDILTKANDIQLKALQQALDARKGGARYSDLDNIENVLTPAKGGGVSESEFERWTEGVRVANRQQLLVMKEIVEKQWSTTQQ